MMHRLKSVRVRGDRLVFALATLAIEVAQCRSRLSYPWYEVCSGRIMGGGLFLPSCLKHPPQQRKADIDLGSHLERLGLVAFEKQLF